MLKNLDLGNIGENVAVFIFGLLFFALGATRLFGGYVLYENYPTTANFLFVEFCALMLAFGITGMIFSSIRILIALLQARKGE